MHGLMAAEIHSDSTVNSVSVSVQNVPGQLEVLVLLAGVGGRLYTRPVPANYKSDGGHHFHFLRPDAAYLFVVCVGKQRMQHVQRTRARRALEFPEPCPPGRAQLYIGPQHQPLSGTGPEGWQSAWLLHPPPAAGDWLWANCWQPEFVQVGVGVSTNFVSAASFCRTQLTPPPPPPSRNAGCMRARAAGGALMGALPAAQDDVWLPFINPAERFCIDLTRTTSADWAKSRRVRKHAKDFRLRWAPPLRTFTHTASSTPRTATRCAPQPQHCTLHGRERTARSDWQCICALAVRKRRRGWFPAAPERCAQHQLGALRLRLRSRPRPLRVSHGSWLTNSVRDAPFAARRAPRRAGRSSSGKGTCSWR